MIQSEASQHPARGYCPALTNWAAPLEGQVTKQGRGTQFHISASEVLMVGDHVEPVSAGVLGWEEMCMRPAAGIEAGNIEMAS